MSMTDVTVVRVYLTEEKKALKELMAYLHDEQKVRGVTVFRGITGFGKSGEIHSSNLLDMSLSLPVAIEFFDEPGKVQQILEALDARLEPGHVVSWQARMNTGETD